MDVFSTGQDIVFKVFLARIITPTQQVTLMPKNNSYNLAREAMIDSQIHPMGVVSEPLLNAFGIVPREDFVPEHQKGICYCDEDIEISKGRYLMEPAVLARLIQAAKPKESDVALTIGSGAGYHAAILSQLVSTVVALDEDRVLLEQAQSVWDKLSYSNIVAVIGPLIEGAPKNAPYDFILFNGAVCGVPEDIKNQMAVGGRLLALVKGAQNTAAKATLIQHISEGQFSDRVLFDAGTPYLQGFEPTKEFVF